MSKPKIIARFIFRWLMLPWVPVLALAWWLESEHDNYIQSVKAVWKGL